MKQKESSNDKPKKRRKYNTQNLKSWKKGQSGNPKGRPLKILPKLEEVLRQELGALSDDDLTSEVHMIIRALITEAKKTGKNAKNTTAAQILLDRAYPLKEKPLAPVAVGPPVINIFTDRDKISKLMQDKNDKLNQKKQP